MFWFVWLQADGGTEQMAVLDYIWGPCAMYDEDVSVPEVPNFLPF